MKYNLKGNYKNLIKAFNYKTKKFMIMNLNNLMNKYKNKKFKYNK